MGKRRRENPSSRSSSSPPAPGHKSRSRPKHGLHLLRDIWWDILILLPAKSLLRLRPVCKAWRSAIDNPFFARAHLDKQYQTGTISSNNNNNTILISTSSTAPPFAPFYWVDLDALIPTKPLQTIPATPAHLPPLPRHQVFPFATCHGLVFDEEKFEIWNPLFGDRLKLPRRRGEGFTLPRRDNLVVGLGYDHATNDYKAVVIDRGGSFNQPYPTYVYSLRSGGSWRRIGDCPCDEDEDDNNWPGKWGPGLYVDGALHWISSGGSENIIFALNLETEEYRKLQPPPFRESHGESLKDVHVLDGCLVVTDFCTEDYNYSFFHFDAWVLEEGSWIKLFSLGVGQQISHLLRPVAYMKNKRHIFLQDYDNFYMVDAKGDELKRVSIRGLFARDLSAQLFQETLFRPKHICGGRVVHGQGRKNMSRKCKRKTSWMMEKCNTELCFSLSDISSPSDTSDSSPSDTSDYSSSDISDLDD